MPNSATVHIIDDDIHMRHSMADLIRFAGHTLVLWADAQAFFSTWAVAETPSIVITDMRMPGMSGLELHRRLVERGLDIPLIYISGESSVHQTISAMKMGAIDFLVKPFTAQELLTAVNKAVESARTKQGQMLAERKLQELLQKLTRRERQVYDLLRCGFNNAEIMAAMGLSLPTVKQYKGAVMRKMEVETLAQLMGLGQIGQAGR